MKPRTINNPEVRMNKILVIEDEKDTLEPLCDILEDEGFQPLQAENGKVGVEMAQKHKPDLILCDINMPEMNGYKVLEELGKNPETSGIPFIFLTVFSKRNDILKGVELGAQDYITKPFDRNDLLARIRMHLRLNSARHKLKEVNDELVDLNELLENSGLEWRDSVGSVANDLKKILQTIDHYTGILKNVYVKDSTSREKVERIQEVGDYMEKLLNELNGESKITSPKK
jgi:DNA-binding response OmpR family regulator